MRRWLRVAGLGASVALALSALSVVLPGRAQPQPPGQLQPPPGMTHLTKAQAIDSASGGAGGPARAVLMEYVSAAQFVGEGVDPGVAPAEEVWLVSLKKGGPGGRAYTVILDGTNGAVIDSCIGCTSLG